MKNIAIFIILLSISISCNTSKVKKEQIIEVNLVVTSTSDYCGGVPPNDKMLENLKMPKTYGNKELFISRDSVLTDAIIQLSLDEIGKTTASLSLGMYYVFFPNKVTAQLTSKENEVPCKRWKNEPNGTFFIETSSADVEVLLHMTCDPCGEARM